MKTLSSYTEDMVYKRETKKIPTYGKCVGVNLMDVLNYETGKIVMVLYNARIHHVKLIQLFLEENKHRLTLVFQPYSPNLNLWGWLKSNVVNNVFFSKVDEICIAVS